MMVASWLSFAIALTFYWVTCDPGASYWDCPEYVTVASKMEVGHPPGNPIWMLAMRVATIPVGPQHHAYVINLCSGLLMAFAVLFLCRLIFIPTRLYLHRLPQFRNARAARGDVLAGCIALGSSLCFAFCDSAWFSAVEAEVYAMSTFLSALSLWVMMLWWWEPGKGRRMQWLILLAYIMGLSLGVHQLNLLLIPVFAVLIVYRNYPRRINPLFVLGVAAASALFIGIILMGLMPGVLFGAGRFELWAVNGLGLPYNSGILIFCAILFLLFLIFLYLFTYFKIRRPGKDGSPVSASTGGMAAANVLWMIAFILLGFSSFGIIMIRSQAFPAMNETSPDNIFALTSYIQRDQYPSTPLLYGHTPYSQAMLEEEFIDGKPYYSHYALEKGKPLFQPVLPGARISHRSPFVSHDDSLMNKSVMESGSGYVLADYDFKQKLTPELNMWLPRITSRNINDRTAYRDWAGASEETMLHIPISQAYDSLGKAVTKMDEQGKRIPVYSYRPTYYQNLRYFVSYQAYYMYFRYLFWNFIGRQNDFPATGEIEHGNFLTGIPLIDSNVLGATDAMPAEIGKENKGRNRYFGIPFIIGIIGIFWLLFSGRRNRRLLTVTLLLFLMTGLAIVVYLNQSPGEPRERDYTFLVSYMAFAMWIASGYLGVATLCFPSRKLKSGKGMERRLLGAISEKRDKGWMVGMGLAVVLTLGTPVLMAVENFDDHDRRGRFQPAYYASSFLDFEYSSIIFSQGDNYSFPFWYATEVLDMGKKHTPVDITYLAMPSYVVNLSMQTERGLETIATIPEIAYGKFILTRIPSDRESVAMPLADALLALYESDNGEWPSSLVTLKDAEGRDVTINLHDFSKGSSYLSFKHLMLLDILAAQQSSPQPRRLYFPYAIDHSFYKPLEPLLTPALFGKVYAPGLAPTDVNGELRQGLSRELNKLSALARENGKLTERYADPVTADRTRRYRGELIIAATEMMQRGDTSLAPALADSIMKFLPYSALLPGDFTVADSTFYEGAAFSRLLKDMASFTGDAKYMNEAHSLDSLMKSRHEAWLGYYRSLPPSQRHTLSRRSLRQLREP